MAEMDQLKAELEKQGYVKFEMKTRNRIFVYVPKSDRTIEIENAAEKLAQYGGYRDTSTSAVQAGGSLGLIRFKDTSSYYNLEIAFKPDASKDLTTDEHESLSAYFTALKFAKPQTDFTLDDFKGANITVQTRFTIDDLFNKASKGWIQSSQLHAERLHRTFGRAGPYVMCQRTQSDFVTNISRKAEELMRKVGKTMGLDKWNPADMWMVKSNLLNTNFDDFESIHELNGFLYDNFKSKDIIGVSLKQAKKTVKAEVYNFRMGHKPVELDRVPLSLGKRGFLESIDGFIFYNNGSSIVLRSFKPTADISAEIQGRFAQGGKVGYGPLQEILKECSKTHIGTKNSDILKSYKANQTRFLKDIYKRARVIDNRLRSISEDTFIKEFNKKPANKKESYIVSKVQALETIETLSRVSKDEVECAISKMISYASSSTDISSVFVKVYTR